MGKEIRELQEELKLREDSIFDQDDEIEKKNAEIKSLKVSIDIVQKEVTLCNFVCRTKLQHVQMKHKTKFSVDAEGL